MLEYVWCCSSLEEEIVGILVTISQNSVTEIIVSDKFISTYRCLFL